MLTDKGNTRSLPGRPVVDRSMQSTAIPKHVLRRIQDAKHTLHTQDIIVKFYYQKD